MCRQIDKNHTNTEMNIGKSCFGSGISYVGGRLDWWIGSVWYRFSTEITKWTHSQLLHRHTLSQKLSKTFTTSFVGRQEHQTTINDVDNVDVAKNKTSVNT